MSRNVSIDILKFVLSLMVVSLHCGFLLNVSPVGNYLTVQGIFRIAVPLFILINGYYFYTIYERQEINLWLKRIAILYIFWMLFYSYFWLGNIEFTSMKSIRGMLITLFFGYWHLWYLPGIIGAALLSIVVLKYSLVKIILISIVLFFIGVFIQYAGNYHIFDNNLVDKICNNNIVHRNFLFLAFPFFMVGVLINKYQLYKIKLSIIKLGTFLGVIFLISESFYNYNYSDGGFDNYLSLIIIAPFVFMLFLNINMARKSKKIALYSSAIYFIHPLFYNLNIDYFSQGTMFSFLIITESIVGAFFLIQLNKKIKFIL